ncbi:MAG: methylmalonyl-CoA mutase [Anaerolineales bacterium]
MSSRKEKLQHDLEQALERWNQGTLARSLKEKPERQDAYHTHSGLPLERVYLPRREHDPLQDEGLPGDYPFTRGVQATMYRGRLWTMRQYAGYATAEETNRRFRYLLEQGQTGLSVAFDLPTQIGYDADDDLSRGEVGRVGVSISSIEDMDRLFERIPLDRVSTSMTINAPAAILLAMYIALARDRGISSKALRGTIQNDILKEYIARGTYIFPPKPAMRLITDVFEFCQDQVPSWNTISVSGYHMREAGSTAVQELAFTLANAIAYLRAAEQAGLDVDDVAPQMAFFFNAHNDFLEEIAKFRAARRMWARITRQQFKAQDPRSWLLRFHTQTAGSTLTAQQPANNVVRVALQALAAILGGTQSLHTNSMDEALGLPTEHAVQLALRTQQVLAYESGVANTIDPLAGSYAIEALTDQVEEAANRYLNQIEAAGGALAAVENGFMQREIHEAAYRTQRAIEAGDELVIGLNSYRNKEDPPLERMKVDPAVEQQSRQQLAALRSRRDSAAVNAALGALREAAQGDTNLMPRLIEAVSARATLGEICAALREIWGEYRPESYF